MSCLQRKGNKTQLLKPPQGWNWFQFQLPGKLQIRGTLVSTIRLTSPAWLWEDLATAPHRCLIVFTTFEPDKILNERDVKKKISPMALLPSCRVADSAYLVNSLPVGWGRIGQEKMSGDSILFPIDRRRMEP